MNESVENAEYYLSLGIDYLWSLVTSQSIPRSAAVCDDGCPVCRKGINKFGHYPWVADSVNMPWKLECPNCGTFFPSNDFEAYYKSGIGKYGLFYPEIADISLLKNTLYPDKPENWCVDDGYGVIDEKSRRYTFAAYYNHWYIWMDGGGASGERKNSILCIIEALKDAYLYTGEARYGRAGIAILDRVADVYPDMDASQYRIEDGYRHNHGITKKGNITGAISECEVAKKLISAYDAFFPEIYNKDCTDVISFLNEKAELYGFDNKKTDIDHIRENIENNIIRLVYPRIKDARIKGNVGMHQSTLAMAALVLEDKNAAEEWMKWLLKPGGLVGEPDWKVTGGNILNVLYYDVDRDGHGNEAAPGYNYLWLSQLKDLADILELYEEYYEKYYKEQDEEFTKQNKARNVINLYKSPKFRKMYLALHPLITLDKYIPSIADSGSSGKPFLYGNKSITLDGFRRYKDPELAQQAYLLNQNKADGLCLNIFHPLAGEIENDVKSVIENKGKLLVESIDLTGYGYAVLKDGSDNTEIAPGIEEDTRKAAWIYYGRTIWHGHQDALNLGIYAFGLDLTPDLGYPEFARHDCSHRTEWGNNTISHNTVVVDAKKQDRMYTGISKHFEDTLDVKIIDVEAPFAYSEIELYRRSIMMIRVDCENSYIVDIFRVKGGNDHYYSFHGAEANVSSEGIEFKKQDGGTYAGPEVEYMERYDDLKNCTATYKGSGFHYLYNVERSYNPEPGFSIDWDIKDTWGALEKDTDIHLRLTMLNRVNSVALSDGQPPQNKVGNPEKLRYMIAHRSKNNDLESQFVSVIEPYKEKRFIKSLEKVSIHILGKITAEKNDKNKETIDTAAIKLVLNNGRTDYIISTLNPETSYLVDNRIIFTGVYGVYSEQGGETAYAFICHGTYMSVDGSVIFNSKYGALTGTLEDFTRCPSFSNRLIVRINEDFGDSDKDDSGNAEDSGKEDFIDHNNLGMIIHKLKGRYIYIENHAARRTGYVMKSIPELREETVQYADIRNAVYRIISAEKIGNNLFALDIGDVTLIRGLADEDDEGKGFLYDAEPGDKFVIPLSQSLKPT